MRADLPPPTKRARPGLGFMKDRSSATYWTQANQVGVSSEISAYLSIPCIASDDDDIDVLGFWKTSKDKYPILAKLATVYLAVHASSAPVERLFSIGGKIFRPERCRLSNNLFESLMFIHCNHDLKL
uniref:HAT C-terminal dimerisation domain-containing protein n=1 Tax=Amphimedon queenslandica TaxID=400682 RepID=A0A1X7TEF4_AMPQE